MPDSVGMDRRTGKVLVDWAHVEQSIIDILTTRILSRVMRREYGSALPDNVDRPMNDAGVLKVYSDIATCLARWEPRFKLEVVNLDEATRDGVVQFSLLGVYIPRGHKGDPTPAGVHTISISTASLLR